MELIADTNIGLWRVSAVLFVPIIDIDIDLGYMMITEPSNRSCPAAMRFRMLGLMMAGVTSA